MHDAVDDRSTRGRGPYRSGEETRQRLIDAALRLFGTHGYDATSTRAIAGQAGVTLPAIAYHFGGKQGLHLACAEHVIALYRGRMLDALVAIQAAMPDAPDPARAALRQVIAMLAAMLLDLGDDDGWMTFMLREMNALGPAHDRLQRELWAPGLGLVAELISRCRGRAIADADDRLEAVLLLSSFSAFTTARAVALDFGGWRAIDPALVSRITERLQARIDAI